MMAPIYPRLMNPKMAVNARIMKLARDGVRWVCERCTSDIIRSPHTRLAVILQRAGTEHRPALKRSRADSRGERLMYSALYPTAIGVVCRSRCTGSAVAGPALLQITP